MYRETMGIVKGIGIGMAAAAAATAIGAKMMKDNKHLRRSVQRAMDAVGQAAVSASAPVGDLFVCHCCLQGQRRLSGKG